MILQILHSCKGKEMQRDTSSPCLSGAEAVDITAHTFRQTWKLSASYVSHLPKYMPWSYSVHFLPHLPPANTEHTASFFRRPLTSLINQLLQEMGMWKLKTQEQIIIASSDKKWMGRNGFMEDWWKPDESREIPALFCFLRNSWLHWNCLPDALRKIISQLAIWF